MLTIRNAGEDVEQNKLSVIGGNAKQPFWKTGRQFLTKLNVVLQNNKAIMFLGSCPNELKT